jgi:hypothetical protein
MGHLDHQSFLEMPVQQTKAHPRLTSTCNSKIRQTLVDGGSYLLVRLENARKIPADNPFSGVMNNRWLVDKHRAIVGNRHILFLNTGFKIIILTHWSGTNED